LQEPRLFIRSRSDKKLLAQAEPGKEILVRIVSMLVGLIRSTSPDRVHEPGAVYEPDRQRAGDYDYDYD